MKIRLINTYEPVNTFYRDLIPYLAKMGVEIEVVISKASYRRGRQERWMIQNVKIVYIPNLSLQPKSKFSKILINIQFTLFCFIYLLFGPKVDRNVFLTQPPLFSYFGFWLKKIRQQDYFQVLMDMYPEVAIQSGMLCERSTFSRLLYHLSVVSLKNAEKVIVIGRDMKEKVQEKGVDVDKIQIIPNWSDHIKIRPISRMHNDFRKNQGWQGKYVLLYSGNLGISHYFEDILEICRRFHDKNELIFSFIGKGCRFNEVYNYKKNYHLKNIILLPFQKEDKLSYSLSAGDLHFVSLRRGFTGLVVPSKVYGILAAGRPIVFQGPLESEIACMIEEENVGSVVRLGDKDGLANVICNYMSNKEMTREQGERARHLAETKYSIEKARTSYAKVLGIL